MTIEERARAAIQPCAHCDRTEPHAFEEPNAHTWDPHHMTVDPAEVLRLIDDRPCPTGDCGHRASVHTVDHGCWEDDCMCEGRPE